MRKKRVLLVNESSYLNTGYATYGMELMTRLHASNKYNLAELGLYGNLNDQRQCLIPWKFYPNIPTGGIYTQQTYDSNPQNDFGAWKIEPTLLDFLPDVVISINDPFHSLPLITRSPFRKFFKHIQLAPVDGSPQEEGWLSDYSKCDLVHAYTDWGIEVLRKESNNKIKLGKGLPCGMNFDIFTAIEDRKGFRSAMQILEDVFIVGTVMRNQRRKLYPDLMVAFKSFLKDIGKEKAEKCFLYCHCYHPDAGWDIPKLLKLYGLGSKVLFTYQCLNCAAVYPSFYQETKTFCKVCQQPTASLPNSNVGVDNRVLSNIYNIFDVYVQYSSCEGLGIPLIEASSCAIPGIAINHSGMSDTIKKLGLVGIEPLKVTMESETHRHMAVGDNNGLVRELHKMFELSSQDRKNLGDNIRAKVKEHYHWDKIANDWMDSIDSLNIDEDERLRNSWRSPIKLHDPRMQQGLEYLSNTQFIKWAIINICGREELLNSHTELRMLRDLNMGSTNHGTGGFEFTEASMLGNKPRYRDGYDRDAVVNELLALCEFHNRWEMERKSLQ